MNKILFWALTSIACLLFSCTESNDNSEELNLFTQYYSAVKNGSVEKWNFTTDTVRLWFDDKNSQPTLQIKNGGLTGNWKEWDEEMNSTTTYDSLSFSKQENAIKGYFYEDNEFYQLIGKSPTKTLRTYWLNEDKKIKEILIYWIPEANTTTSEHLKPIVTWALLNDSAEISALYPDGKIIPSRDNALRWKKLLKKYKEAQNSD